MNKKKTGAFIICLFITLAYAFAGNSQSASNKQSGCAPVLQNSKLGSFLISATICEDNICFSISFEEETEKRSHKSWIWDPAGQHYIEGEDRETVISLLIQSDSANFADIWIWRSFMSDPAGIAEDMFFIGNPDLPDETNIRIIPDQGKRCWITKYYAEFAGEKLPRFVHRKPDGSAADLSAQSSWSDGVWKITLSRKLDTGSPDDIQFLPGKEYKIIVYKGLPCNNNRAGEIKLSMPEKMSQNDKLQ